MYEWDQTLADISLYVQVPQGVKAKDLQVDIKADSVAFGLRGRPPFLSVSNPACRCRNLASDRLSTWSGVCFDTLSHLCSPRAKSDRRAIQPIGFRSLARQVDALQKPLAKRAKPSESFWTLGEHDQRAAPTAEGSVICSPPDHH